MSLELLIQLFTFLIAYAIAYWAGIQRGKFIATEIFSKANEEIQKIFYENREKTVKSYEAAMQFLIEENKELRNLNEYMIEHFGSKFTFPHDLCTDKNNFGGDGKNGL